jgi:hypothetical protein
MLPEFAFRAVGVSNRETWGRLPWSRRDVSAPFRDQSATVGGHLSRSSMPRGLPPRLGLGYNVTAFSLVLAIQLERAAV